MFSSKIESSKSEDIYSVSSGIKERLNTFLLKCIIKIKITENQEQNLVNVKFKMMFVNNHIPYVPIH